MPPFACTVSAGRRALLLGCVAAGILLGASGLPARAASAPGGSGTLTPSGRVGPLQIDYSGLAAVLAFAGEPAAQTIATAPAGRNYDALGYHCSGSRLATEAPVGRHTWCHTAFYIDIRSNTLEQFFTTSRRYHDNHGVRVGMSTAAVDRREGRAAIVGCSEGMAIRSGGSALVIAMAGGHWRTSGRPRQLFGGHVALLAVDSEIRRPGVFVCI